MKTAVREQCVVFGRPQRREPARGQVGGNPDAEIGPVHMRVPPGAEGVAFGVSLGQPG